MTDPERVKRLGEIIQRIEKLRLRREELGLPNLGKPDTLAESMGIEMELLSLFAEAEKLLGATVH
jgi:hypothetical protein